MRLFVSVRARYRHYPVSNELLLRNRGAKIAFLRQHRLGTQAWLRWKPSSLLRLRVDLRST